MAALECQAAESPSLGKCQTCFRGFEITEHSDPHGNGKEGARESHVAAGEAGSGCTRTHDGAHILRLSLPALQSRCSFLYTILPPDESCNVALKRRGKKPDTFESLHIVRNHLVKPSVTFFNA